MIRNINEVLVYTNNPFVRDKLQGKVEVKFFDLNMLGLLREVKISVSGGCGLLSHPLSGSVKPGETPYKSILLSKSKTDDDPLMSVELIDGALERTLSFFTAKHLDDSSGIEDFNLSESVLDDFRLVDYTLVYSALESVPGFTQLFAV